MRSVRFSKAIILTRHATKRMKERSVDRDLVLDLIESGVVREMGPGRFLIHKTYPGRRDNLVCAAIADEDKLVVKTVMVNWTLRETS